MTPFVERLEDRWLLAIDGLGVAGALEAVATVLALKKGVLPPTANFTEPDPEFRFHSGTPALEERAWRAIARTAGSYKARDLWRRGSWLDRDV